LRGEEEIERHVPNEEIHESGFDTAPDTNPFAKLSREVIFVWWKLVWRWWRIDLSRSQAAFAMDSRAS
jgi:hypothetical protein